MKAFSQTIKKPEFLAEIEKHRKADQIIKGTYGKKNGVWKGCAVGCSIHSINALKGKHYKTDNHKIYETELGIPEAIARLEDAIFEGLPADKAVLWPEKFTKAINPGADLSLVTAKFIVWLFAPSNTVYKNAFLDGKQAIKMTRKLYQRRIKGDEPSEADWSAAWSAAESARSAAESARSVAWSAAESAAWSAAESARSAARSAAESAWSAAESAAYEKMATQLIKILKEAK